MRCHATDDLTRCHERSRSSTTPWLEARPGCACAGDSVIGVYERAMAQVWMRLEALAQQHGVMDQLQVFVSVRARAPWQPQRCDITGSGENQRLLRDLATLLMYICRVHISHRKMGAAAFLGMKFHWGGHGDAALRGGSGRRLLVMHVRRRREGRRKCCAGRAQPRGRHHSAICLASV